LTTGSGASAQRGDEAELVDRQPQHGGEVVGPDGRRTTEADRQRLAGLGVAS